MGIVKVFIQNNQKDEKIPTGIRLLIRRCCNATLTFENFNKLAEVSVTFLNDEQIKQINKEFRNKDVPTDVLSFPLGENGVYDKNEDLGTYMLGDIAISIPTAVKQAKLYGHSLRREIGFLTVHSMLHLLGYDHEDGGAQALAMREKEETILNTLGLRRDIVIQTKCKQIESHIQSHNTNVYKI